MQALDELMKENRDIGLSCCLYFGFSVGSDGRDVVEHLFGENDSLLIVCTVTVKPAVAMIEIVSCKYSG